MMMPKIQNCETQKCSYNSDMQCHAAAITVGGNHPACDTFMAGPEKGGSMDSIGSVGACKVKDCRFNQSLECSAPKISVATHSDHADCMTYKLR
jgi:hypothetical protein